jgi:hypothetical protein
VYITAEFRLACGGVYLAVFWTPPRRGGEEPTLALAPRFLGGEWTPQEIEWYKGKWQFHHTQHITDDECRKWANRGTSNCGLCQWQEQRRQDGGGGGGGSGRGGGSGGVGGCGGGGGGSGASGSGSSGSGSGEWTCKACGETSRNTKSLCKNCSCRSLEMQLL